jgi:hypothetical protein
MSHQRFQVYNLGDQYDVFRSEIGSMLKIRSNPVEQYRGFPDIDNVALSIFEEIDARLFGEIAEYSVQPMGSVGEGIWYDRGVVHDSIA